MRTFIPVAVAFVALSTLAAGPASANGLTSADHQFVSGQSLTDTYAVPAKPVATITGSVPLTDAESVNVIHQQEKFGN